MKKQLAILAALAALTSFGAIRAVTPGGYDPNCWQMKRHNEKMAVVTNGGAKVVFVGDSITHGWEGAGKAQWAKYFADGKYRALNLGTGADRTEEKGATLCTASLHPRGLRVAWTQPYANMS